MSSEDKVVPMKDQNALVMGDGKVYKIQKVRQRKIHSCVPCHQRKVKCSRETPICSNCIKNGLDCKYFVNDRVSRGKKTKDLDKEADMKRKKELKQYMAKAKIIASTSPPPPTISSSSQGTSSSPQEPQQLKGLLNDQQPVQAHSHQQVEDPSPKNKSLTFSDSDSLISNESLSPPKLHNPQTLPTEKSVQNPSHLSQQIGNNSFQLDQFSQGLNSNLSFNGTYSQVHSIPSNIQQQQQLLRSDTLQSNLLQHPQPITQPLQHSHQYPQQIQLQQHSAPPVQQQLQQAEPLVLTKEDEIIQALPTRQRSYGLVKRYISTIHPIIPIIDINEFLAEHDQFWNDRHENKFEFLGCLFPILYAASKAECFEFSYDEITKYELSNEIHKYLRVAREVLTLINFPLKYSLRILQSAVILQSTLENPSITDISILVRIAQSIRLHRDPATFHNIADPGLVQSRRLLWWQIFYLDAITSLNQMCTPLIKLDEFDTSLPVEFVNNILHCETCFLNGKFRFSLILNELTKFIYGISILPFNTIQLLKQKILDLHISCNASIMNLSSAQQIRNLTFDESKFINWSKSVLNTYCDRALLLLQNKIILSNVLNTNEDDNNHIFNSSYNQMMNNSKLKFNIEALFRSSTTSSVDGNANILNNYSYDDLSNNLIPASLHYLYEFWKNNNDDIYNSFNWEIRNTVPFDSIILILTNLISDLEKNYDSSYELKNDIRYYLLDKSIDLIFIKFDNKKRSIFKNCFTLMRYLFQILRLRYLKNNNGAGSSYLEFNNLNTEQIIPKPIKRHMNDFKKNGIDSHNYLQQQQQFENSSLGSKASIDFISPAAKWDMQTTSCSQIAPRTMRAIAASSTNPISFNQTATSGTSGFGDDLNDQFNFGPEDDFTAEDVWNPTSIVGGSNMSNSTSLNNSNNNSTNGMFNDDEYKRLELQRIKLQITKFLQEERLSDDDKFNNKYYIWCENEVKQLIERLI